MVEIARDTCISTFPSYRNIAPRLAAKGLAQDELGTWRGESAIVVFRKASGSNLDCEVWMSKNSKTNDVSDRLQAKLSNMGVRILSATRKGVRLSANFSKDGAAGTLRVEPMSGRTSKIVISHGAGS